jgi:hypothetical protein
VPGKWKSIITELVFVPGNALCIWRTTNCAILIMRAQSTFYMRDVITSIKECKNQSRGTRFPLIKPPSKDSKFSLPRVKNCSDLFPPYIKISFLNKTVVLNPQDFIDFSNTKI